MRRFIFIICVLVLIIVASYFLTISEPSVRKITKSYLPLSPTVTHIVNKPMTKTLFVPYWTMSGHVDSSGYDQLVYFGITADKNGIDETEIGYKSLTNFMNSTDAHKKRLLGVRLLNTDSNTAILNDKNLQNKIISRSVEIAKEKGFDGIVLDFEISALGFDAVTKNISTFETSYADAVRKNNLTFFATIYGDTFARFRPFDVKTIAAHADGIMIMAYDFHKANGTPGPNFPLKDNQDEGYDFETMIHDFLQQTSPEKITVVFGLYGYDWIVDAKGDSVSPADSLSDYKILQKFLISCSYAKCNIIKDPVSAETKITYTDADNKNHIVWFENVQSVAEKTMFLQANGISSIAYWAYSYF